MLGGNSGRQEERGGGQLILSFHQKKYTLHQHINKSRRQNSNALLGGHQQDIISGWPYRSYHKLQGTPWCTCQCWHAACHTSSGQTSHGTPSCPYSSPHTSFDSPSSRARNARARGTCFWRQRSRQWGCHTLRGTQHVSTCTLVPVKQVNCEPPISTNIVSLSPSSGLMKPTCPRASRPLPCTAFDEILKGHSQIGYVYVSLSNTSRHLLRARKIKTKNKIQKKSPKENVTQQKVEC